jgi:Flp pilus assembly pilin Flp
MRFLRRIAKQFSDREDGAAAAEYAIMLALIVGVCVATIGTLGINTKQVCNVVCTVLGRN